jgi:hypothetical protein
MSKCHYSFGWCRRPKRSYYCSRENYIAAQTAGASKKKHDVTLTTRRAHPAVTVFGTLISRSFSFVCLFRQSVHFFVYRFSIQFFLSFRFQLRSFDAKVNKSTPGPI